MTAELLLASQRVVPAVDQSSRGSALGPSYLEVDASWYGDFFMQSAATLASGRSITYLDMVSPGGM
jgi:hypothetical protein